MQGRVGIIGTGATASNLVVDNNNIQTAARAVSVQGSATSVFPGLTISNNLIGNDDVFAAAFFGVADEVIQELLSIQWWNWSEEKLRKAQTYFTQKDIHSFIKWVHDEYSYAESSNNKLYQKENISAS